MDIKANEARIAGGAMLSVEDLGMPVELLDQV